MDVDAHMQIHADQVKHWNEVSISFNQVLLSSCREYWISDIVGYRIIAQRSNGLD